MREGHETTPQSPKKREAENHTAYLLSQNWTLSSGPRTLRVRSEMSFRFSGIVTLCLATGLVWGWCGQAGAGDAQPALRDTLRQKRSPTGAMWRSLALPGWGQFYNRHPFKGGIIAVAETGSVAAFFVRRRQIQRQAQPGFRRNVFLHTTIGIVLYSMVDAYVDAYLDAVDWDATVRAGPNGMEAVLALKVRF